jgi:hypothetical protein
MPSRASFKLLIDFSLLRTVEEVPLLIAPIFYKAWKLWTCGIASSSRYQIFKSILNTPFCIVHTLNPEG